MARQYAKVYASIWRDREFVGLSPEAQRLYLLVLSQPGITNCGVVPYTPRRWARLAAGVSVGEIEDAVHELQEARFVIVDDETEEIWIRSFIRHDGVLKTPQLRQAMHREAGHVQSERIRSGIAQELAQDSESDGDNQTETPPDKGRNMSADGSVDGSKDGSGNPSADGSIACASRARQPYDPMTSSQQPADKSDHDRTVDLLLLRRRQQHERSGKHIDNPDAWTWSVRAGLQREHGDRIAADLALGLAPDTIAASILPDRNPDPPMAAYHRVDSNAVMQRALALVAPEDR
jgi:hypothetical protein